MKRIILTSLLIGGVLAINAQDTPCTATAVSVNAGCTSGDNSGSTSDGISPSCWFAGDDNSVWFSVVATNDSLTFSTDFSAQTLTDTEIAVYSSSDNTCTGTFTQVGCDDDGGVVCALCSEVSLTGLTVGDTYFIVVDGFGGSTGTFCMSVSEPLPPAPDFGSSCDLAHQLYSSNSCYSSVTDGNIGIGDNMTSTGSVDQSCSAADDSNEPGYWLTFDAVDALTTFDAPDFTGPNTANFFDISVYTGSCSMLTQIDCRSVASKSNDYTLATVPGTTYYVFMTAGSAYSGSVLRMSICGSTACSAPGNDNCANATAVTDGTVYQGTNACATNDEGLCSGSTENNVWYSWTVPGTWTAGESAFVTLFDQDCYVNDPTTTSSGSQVSVYNATETCATISGTASECAVFTNPGDDEDFYGEWIPTVGSTYLINIDGFGGDACTFEFQVNDTPVPLPVEWLDFTAKYFSGQVLLNWTTAEEMNNDYFTVERSSDGLIFTPILEVDGAGNSTAIKQYESADPQPLNGVSYYRLKQTDYDGKFKYSRIQTVKSNFEIADVQVIPNPVEEIGIVSFDVKNGGNYIVEVMDIAGRWIKEDQVAATEGRNNVRFNMSDLPEGLYFVRVRNQFVQATARFVRN